MSPLITSLGPVPPLRVFLLPALLWCFSQAAVVKSKSTTTKLLPQCFQHGCEALQGASAIFWPRKPMITNQHLKTGALFRRQAFTPDHHPIRKTAAIPLPFRFSAFKKSSCVAKRRGLVSPHGPTPREDPLLYLVCHLSPNTTYSQSTITRKSGSSA